MKKILLFAFCLISSAIQAQLTEHPTVKKTSSCTEVDYVRVQLFGVEAVIKISVYDTWVRISSNTTLSFIDPNTNKEKEIPISFLERFVGTKWVASNLDKKYRLSDFGGARPSFRLNFKPEDPLPESLDKITIKEKGINGFTWKNIKILPVNNHYREDKNIGNRVVIDSLVNQSKNPNIGIYENADEDYSIAFLEYKGKPCLIFYDGNAGGFLNQGGDMIAELNPSVHSNIYMGTFYDYLNQSSERAVVRFDEGLMAFKIGDKPENTFVKVLSTGNNNKNTDTEQNNILPDLKSTGSGFIVSGKVVATNFHVVDGASKITVTLTTDGVFEEYNARVLSVDKTNDLALVTIKDDKFIPLKPAPYRIATSASDVGTSVFTMGYPMTNILGEEMKITDGIISSKTGFKGSATEYQISAPIQPGNSGGALFDKSGNLIGITNAGLKNESVENVNYAIKTNYLLNLIDSAPIDIELPRGENVSGKTLPELIKAYKPYVAIIKVY
jgi:S1-C subfamily serine protease